MNLRQLRLRQWPIALMADYDLFARMANVELDPRLLVTAVPFSFEEITKELLLQIDAVICVVMRPMLDAVHFEPFLFGSRSEETFKVAAGMQRLVPPVGRREQRHFHFRPIRQHRLVEVVVKRMCEIGLSEVIPVSTHL